MSNVYFNLFFFKKNCLWPLRTSNLITIIIPAVWNERSKVKTTDDRFINLPTKNLTGGNLKLKRRKWVQNYWHIARSFLALAATCTGSKRRLAPSYNSHETLPPSHEMWRQSPTTQTEKRRKLMRWILSCHVMCLRRHRSWLLALLDSSKMASLV